MIDDAHEENDRPWDRFGAPRWDCEPHRSQFLKGLGIMSSVIGVASMLMASVFYHRSCRG